MELRPVTHADPRVRCARRRLQIVPERAQRSDASPTVGQADSRLASQSGPPARIDARLPYGSRAAGTTRRSRGQVFVSLGDGTRGSRGKSARRRALRVFAAAGRLGRRVSSLPGRRSGLRRSPVPRFGIRRRWAT